MRHLPLSRLEIALLVSLIGALALACLGPALSQSQGFHGFADQRLWLGLPNAMDVLSNLPFALWGGVGLLACWRHRVEGDAAQRALAALFFAGLAVTAAASSRYHLQPNNHGLAVDRCGMVVAFAGLLGLAVAGRISARAGLALAGATLLLGPWSVWVWLQSGNVLPWALVQFGGMALVLWMASIKPRPGAWPVRWALVIAVYALAKVLEQADQLVFAWDHGWVSGHSLKHVVASLAASPVVVAMQQMQRGAKQNGQQVAAESSASRHQARYRANSQLTQPLIPGVRNER